MSTLPITIPNTFANATSAIPLISLDNNFSSVVTALNGIGDGSTPLANLTATGGNVTLTSATVTTANLTQINAGNASVTGTVTTATANVTTLNVTNANAGNVTVTGSTNVASANVTGTLTAGNVTATTNVAAGNVVVTSLVSGATGTFSGNVSGGNVSATALVSGANVTASNTVTAANLSVTTNATFANATFTGTVTGLTVNLNAVSAINNGPIAGFRNRIINGNFVIDQRNGGASQTITTSGAYTVDRWLAAPTGASVTGQRIAGSAPSQYRYQFTGAASVTGITMTQRIEAANCFDMAGQTVTVGVDLANSVLTSVGWALYYAGSTDTWTSPTLISSGTWTVSSTLARKNAQISVPAAATTGLQLVLSVGAQTSGTWTIGDVQLELGSTASTFERRFVGTELALCYRYFYKTLSTLTVTGLTTGGGPVNYCGRFNYPVTARISPTVTTTTWVNSSNMPSASIVDASAEGFTYQAATATVAGQGASGYYPAGITASAEL